MPKYTNDIVAGYILYFTSKCILEAMHVHASDRELSEYGSAKLYVYENGDTTVQAWGTVNAQDMKKIRAYVKANHEEMYRKWTTYSDNGYYRQNKPKVD